MKPEHKAIYDKAERLTDAALYYTVSGIQWLANGRYSFVILIAVILAILLLIYS